MSMFILTNAPGIDPVDLDPIQIKGDLGIIANDSGLAVEAEVNGQQHVTYARTLSGVVQMRLDTLVNTTFTPDYGTGPQNVDIIAIGGLEGFIFNDGSTLTKRKALTLPPMNSGLPGSALNTTNNCITIYDTKLSICVAREGSEGRLNLSSPTPVVFYHELSHAFRICLNKMLSLAAPDDCTASPEEHAAETDENDLRTDLANRQGTVPELRDPNNHCGRDCGEVVAEGGSATCCTVASVASGSSRSSQVEFLRSVRDNFVRNTELGHDFFEKLHKDYYSFSPQVCTILAENKTLNKYLLEGYINPLLDFWQIMIERSRSKMSNAELGAAFVRLNQDQKNAEEKRKALQRTIDYWQKKSESNNVPKELTTLLKERAWTSEYVKWGLIDPIRIYYDLLVLYLKGAGESEIGQEFNRELESWTSEIPISDIWLSFPPNEMANGLKYFERVLFQSKTAEKRFSKRLQNRFRGIKTINFAWGDERNLGDVQ